VNVNAKSRSAEKAITLAMLHQAFIPTLIYISTPNNVGPLIFFFGCEAAQSHGAIHIELELRFCAANPHIA